MDPVRSAVPLGVATSGPQARPRQLPEKVQWTPKPTRDQAASLRMPGCVCVCVFAHVHVCVCECMCVCVCTCVMQIREQPPCPVILPFLTVCTQAGDRKLGCRPRAPGWSVRGSLPPPTSCPRALWRTGRSVTWGHVHVPSASRSTPFWGEGCGEAPLSPWGTPSAVSV